MENAAKEINWIPLNQFKPKAGQYLYLLGGTYSPDKGCPDWGSNRDEDTYYPGDCAGKLVISYSGGKVDEVPLIFGYTLWFAKHFSDGQAPFFGEDSNPRMTQLLQDTLFLKGGTTAQSPYMLCIKLSGDELKSVEVQPSPQKKGEPVYTHYAVSDTNQDEFFISHVIDPEHPLPERVTSALSEIAHALFTFDPQDYLLPPRFEFPIDYDGVKVRFTGNAYAEIATGVFYENMMAIYHKIGEDGKVHESSYMAPSWRYDGFGTWRPGANSYYTQMWTRNHHSITAISRLGFKEKADKAVEYSQNCMMYFKREKLTLGGKPIPGHWTAVCDDPMYYSKVLQYAGWYTKYTQEKFGDEFQNLGNFEVDGHGFAMLGIYNVWKSEGKSVDFVKQNLEEISEPVKFIQWCLDNPELSFSEHGLLYGETEAGLADIAFGAGMKITMYGNIACCLGVRAYSDMVRCAGMNELADEWLDLSKKLEKSILDYFVKEGKWDLYNRGFYHDSSLPTYSDYAGYDALHDVPENWYNLSRDTYEEDFNDYIGDTFVGPRGIGYDHSIFTQTALLLDKVSDYTRLLENLCKICYSPRLPQPYIVPECASYSPNKKMFRRQGDLGNLAHQAEVMHTFMTVIGLCATKEGTFKWIPRLPKGWAFEAEELPLPDGSATINLKYQFPDGGRQKVCIQCEKEIELLFRAGPFEPESHVTCFVNGERHECETEICGEGVWGRIKLQLEPGKHYIVEAGNNI